MYLMGTTKVKYYPYLVPDIWITLLKHMYALNGPCYHDWAYR